MCPKELLYSLIMNPNFASMSRPVEEIVNAERGGQHPCQTFLGKGMATVSIVKASLLAALICVPAPAAAQDLAHRPISPTFSGDPFNSNHVLGAANANNNTRDPRSTSTNSQGVYDASYIQKAVKRAGSLTAMTIVDQDRDENKRDGS